MIQFDRPVLSSCACLKVDVPNLVTYFDQTPIFEKYLVRCGVQTRYPKYILNYVLKI